MKQPPHILVLHNQPVLPPDHPYAESEHEIVENAGIVAGILEQAGYRVSLLSVGHDPAALVAGLRREQPDLVFNLFEGTADNSGNEAQVAGVLEWLGIPFTGCPALALTVARDKPLAKRLFRGAGLATPEFFEVEALPLKRPACNWPLVVKPAREDASLGLDQGSVVTNRRRLEERVAFLLEHYGPPVLVEEYVAGREFAVGVVEAPEPKVLPVGEIVFTIQAPGYWPIVTYDAKWKPGTPDYDTTPPVYPARIGARLRKKLEDMATRAFRLTGCRDYARADFRVDASGKPFLLEINPNPAFGPMAGLAVALKAAGSSHARFTIELVRRALERSAERSARHNQVRPDPNYWVEVEDDDEDAESVVPAQGATG